MNFWQQLSKPIMVVAPMADVTDAAFRRLLAKYSKTSFVAADGENVPCGTFSPVPNEGREQSLSTEGRQTVGGRYVTWTEFVSADGLVLAPPEGKKKLLADLIYSEEERPIIAQLFSSNEEHMEAAARLVSRLGFDGVDINMGCPDRSIEKQGCGSAMIKTPEVAQTIIRAAKRGASDLPVSVKTRIGYNEDEIETWIPAILAEKPAALTVHLRTRKQMSKVPADWEKLKEVVKLRDKLSPETVVLGNGDVLSLEDGHQKALLSGADGVMIGRALFGNPWFFNSRKSLPTKLTALPTHGVNRETIIEEDTSNETLEYVTLTERLNVMVEHTKLFVKLLPFKNFSVMKKHYKAYVNGFRGAAELRGKLMNTNTPEEVEEIVHQFLAEVK